MEETDLANQIQQYKWFHVIPVNDRLQTPGIKDLIPHQQMILKELQNVSFNEKRVLDIGCRDGLFSFFAEEKGGKVLAIDNELSKGATELLIPLFSSSVEMKELNLFDLPQANYEKFDIILMLGVLYHLKYPFYAIKIIRDLLNTDGVFVCETMITATDRQEPPKLTCLVGKYASLGPHTPTMFNYLGVIESICSFGFKLISAQTMPDANPAFNRLVAVFARVETTDAHFENYFDATHNFHQDVQQVKPEYRSSIFREKS